MKDFISIVEASELTGKTVRTIRHRLSKLSAVDRQKYIKRGYKNSLLIEKKWIVSQYKTETKPREKPRNEMEAIKLYERLLQEREQRIQEQAKTIQVLEKQVNITNSYLASKDKEYRKLIEKSSKQLNAPAGIEPETKSNWFQRLFGN